MAPGLRRLSSRQGNAPRLAPKWPCHQLDEASSAEYIERLSSRALDLEGAKEAAPPLNAAGRAFTLDEALAKGQPESCVFASVWLIIRPEGSLHLTLRPEWAQKVVSKGWGTVHPFARYMAGAVPPQSLVIYAPRDARELDVVGRIVEASHGYASGRLGSVVLPDSRW
jgi:hypothetical protein